MLSHLSIPLLLVEGDVKFNSPVSLLYCLLSPMPMPLAVVPNLVSCITAASPVQIISDLASHFSDILSGELLTPNVALSTWLPTGCYCAVCAYMKAIRSARATIHWALKNLIFPLFLWVSCPPSHVHANFKWIQLSHRIDLFFCHLLSLHGYLVITSANCMLMLGHILLAPWGLHKYGCVTFSHSTAMPMSLVYSSF